MVTVLWNLHEERGELAFIKHQRFAKCFAYITSSNPHNNPGKLNV